MKPDPTVTGSLAGKAHTRDTRRRPQPPGQPGRPHAHARRISVEVSERRAGTGIKAIHHMEAAKKFLSRAREVVGHRPTRITIDGHDATREPYVGRLAGKWSIGPTSISTIGSIWITEA